MLNENVQASLDFAFDVATPSRDDRPLTPGRYESDEAPPAIYAGSDNLIRSWRVLVVGKDGISTVFHRQRWRNGVTTEQAENL